jgi:hypothetical protein
MRLGSRILRPFAVCESGKGLGRRHLLHQMPVDVDQIGSISIGLDDVLHPRPCRTAFSACWMAGWNALALLSREASCIVLGPQTMLNCMRIQHQLNGVACDAVELRDGSMRDQGDYR